MMKKNIFIIILGVIGPIVFFVGMLFWIQHWAGAKELKTVGLLMFSIFWIWILVNIIKSKLLKIQKVIWIIFILFLPMFATWAYYFIFRQKNKDPNLIDTELLLDDEDMENEY